MTDHVSRRSFLKTCGWALPGLTLGASAGAATVKKPLPPVDLGFVEEAVLLARRSAWTDTPPRLWRLRGARGFHRLTVHHCGSVNRHTNASSVIHDLDGVLTSHRQRRFADIGYHFVVDYAGRVWEGRSLAYEGAHVSGENPGNIGVMLLGNFERQHPSADQLGALDRLVGVLRRHYGIKKHRVYGHRDLGQSVCPGRHLYAHVQGLRATAP